MLTGFSLTAKVPFQRLNLHHHLLFCVRFHWPTHRRVMASTADLFILKNPYLDHRSQCFWCCCVSVVSGHCCLSGKNRKGTQKHLPAIVWTTPCASRFVQKINWTVLHDPNIEKGRDLCCRGYNLSWRPSEYSPEGKVSALWKSKCFVCLESSSGFWVGNEWKEMLPTNEGSDHRAGWWWIFIRQLHFRILQSNMVKLCRIYCCESCWCQCFHLWSFQLFGKF